jgi:proton-translocating NADH-quinone oxidoreductase chain N
VSRWLALLPEAALTLSALMVFAALLSERDRTRRARRAAFAGGVLLLAASLATLGADQEFFWATYRVDAFSQLVKVAVAVGFLISAFIVRNGEGQREDVRAEVFFFLLTSTAGLVALASAVEMVSLYLALEIASFSLFVLVPMRDRFELGREAALKFIVVGLAASAVTLFGLSLVVGYAGTTRLDQIAVQLPALGREPVVVFGLALFLAGLLFKLAVFPFHFWAPDVYQGASHGVAAFVATTSKVGAIAILTRLITVTELSGTQLVTALAVMAAVSMTLGNLVAIVQRDVKRLLAYSAVAQAGYVVVGLVAFTQDGMAAALFYGLLYLLMNSAAFLVVARVGADGSNPTLDDLRGLHRRSPLLAATLLLALFALAGVPPTAGFAGKWFLFSAAMAQGWWLLVLLGAINSTVSVYYYLVAIKHAYLLPEEPARGPLPLTLGDRALCYLLSGAVLVLGVYPTPLYHWAERAAQFLP